MSEPWQLVTDLVALNGGRLVGKTRLQKTVYLLDACGLGSDFDFDYHHFGPFSADLAEAADGAWAMGMVQQEPKTGSHGVPYVIYSSNAPKPVTIGEMPGTDAENQLAVLAAHSALDLEVAATLYFLRANGYGKTAEAELVVRKPLKATPERIAVASNLLIQLGIH